MSTYLNDEFDSINKIKDLINKVSNLFEYKQIITTESLIDLKPKENTYDFKFQNSNYIYEAYIPLNNDFNLSELLSYLQVIVKGLGIKKFKFTLNPKLEILDILDNLNIKYEMADSKNIKLIVEDNDFNEYKILEIVLDDYLYVILKFEDLFKATNALNKRYLTYKKPHLLIVYDSNIVDTLRISNICRIGGLQTIIRKDFDTDALFIADFQNIKDNMCELFISETESIEMVNINDIYPFIMNYLNQKNKCVGCASKEE